MIKQVSTSNDYGNVNVRQNMQPQTFEGSIPAMPNDSFQSTTQQPVVVEKKFFFGWFDAACLAGLGGTLFAWKKGHADNKELGKVVSEVGKSVSETFEKIGEKMPECLKEAAEKLRKISTTDALSGLNNRASFNAALTKTTKEATEGGKEAHMAMLDMDFFKSINEILGHQTGDRFIQLLSKNISDVAAEHGVNAYRYGGEEIAVLMPGHNAESAKNIVTKMAEKIKGDTEIQGHKDEFLKKAQERLAEFTQHQSNYDNLWERIRSTKKIKQNELAGEVLKYLGENPQAETPAERKSLQEAVKKLHAIKEGKSKQSVHDVVKEHKPVVASNLNKQHNRQDEITHLNKWIDHVSSNHGFTVSAGIGGVKTNEPEELLKKANTALEKKAKTVRNTIAIAD